MSKAKKVALVFISAVLHLVAGGVIYYFWRPILLWYWNYRPILGVDFYNLVSYVAYLARHFVFQFNGWKYVWWGGGPLFLDYPTLHAYLTLPLLKIFSLPQAVQAYVLVSGFLFLFFSYLLFVEIGQDRVLATVLTIASSFSVGLYGALFWGGSLPYFATQFFLPLVVWLLVKFFNTTDQRWFYLSSLVLGVSYLGHPQVGFSYAIPIAFLLLLTYPIEGEKFINGKRIKRIFLYFLIALLVGYPSMYVYIGRSPLEIINVAPKMLKQIFPRSAQIFGKLLRTEKGPASIVEEEQRVSGQTAVEISKFNRAQLERFISDTNKLFFSFLAAAAIIFTLSFLIRKKRGSSLKGVVFALPVLWVVFYNCLFAFGIGIFHGGWYRVFWPFPLALGILISFVWGDFLASIKERVKVLERKFVFRTALAVTSGIIVLFPGFLLLRQNSSQAMISGIESPGFRQQSSALPDSLNICIDKEEFEKLSKRLTPSWLDPNDTQYRLYEGDQRVNIWWNALFDMPLVKGYVEMPPGDSSTGAFYWTSIALTGGANSLVESWGLSEEMAYNNALFLIDWFSIKFIEAEHPRSDSYNPLTSYLAEADIFANKEKVIIPGWAQLYEVPKGSPIVWHPEEEESLSYYEVRDDLVSPIAHTTNAPTIGVIGAEGAYHTFIRDLAAVNLNSKRVIPIRLGQFIDKVSYQSLKDMDAVILYAYDYRNHGKVWAKLEKYVEEGGRVFIETGSEVKQTDSVNLPAKYPKELPSIFPIKITRQEKMGGNWQLSGGGREVEGIDLEAFGPPAIDGEPWLFSQPNSAEDLRERSRVILSANGVPLIVSWKYGEGEVIWSGMNLPYHIITHKNLEEAKLFENLLGDFIDISAVSYSGFEVKRESANKVEISGSKAKGVFLRENSYPVWEAEIKSRAKAQPSSRAVRLSSPSKPQVEGKPEVYEAGPTFHGFSYVRIPKEAQESFTVTFSYKGEFWVYFWQAVSLMTILLALDRIILNSRLVIPVLRKALTPLRKRVGKWWEREEEY